LERISIEKQSSDFRDAGAYDLLEWRSVYGTEIERIRNMDWFFDGIGTELIGILVGLVIGAGTGGAIGYRIGVRKNALTQKQKAGNNSRQKQIGKILEGVDRDSTQNITKVSCSRVNQKQNGGEDSIQSQLGGINSDD
jgi:hypothetical protein